ncbi:uncharacterized protein LOC135939792 [Cloeon dipterum]|uniref:uncharacterized protein LOC135939792 n=1 Tax=Cloeon dipterum TaxID=197152 RepID=UPI00321F7EEB
MESAAKRKKMCRNDSAEGSAERVIGFWDKAVAAAAAAVRLTCILIIHYNYAGQNKKDRSKDDSADCERIKKTFGTCLNTRVRDTSGRSDEVLDLIGSEEGMRNLFNLNGDQKPELFMVFIMTHGGSDGLLKTHHGDQFYVSNVLEQLHRNASLEDALKLLVVSACRGDIQEEVIYRREEMPFDVQGVILSSQLDIQKFQNLNATQIKSVSGMENIVILSSCVERTTSPRAGGTFLIQSFCNAFERLERNVDLEEFLTRVLNIHHSENKKWGYGSTPEYMVITQRRLTFSRQSFDGKGREEEEGSYSWLSDAQTPLLKRDAHVYLNSASSSTRETVNLIKEDLRKIFSFDVKNHSNLKQLQSSVGDQDGEKAGCIFMLIVTMLSRNVTTGELCVLMNGQMIPMKFVLNTMIGPTTANWIGKPKICVFLNTSADTESLAIDVSRDYPRTQYTVSGTIHSGLLTLILPQNDAPDFFLKTLTDFAATKKIESGTFQQFFHEVLQKASTANDIPPMIVSTLPKSLEMKFPKPIVIDSFRMTTPKETFNVSLTDLERLVSMAGAIKIWPNAQAEETFAIDAASKGVVPKGANPMTQIEEPSNMEVEVMAESEENEAEEQAPEYNVFLVVAEAGSGKSHLAAHLAKFAQNRRLVTLLDDPDRSKGFKALHEEYLNNQPFGANQVLFLDAIDALHEELLEKVLRMVQALAENKVDLWIFTRPEGGARLRGLFPVTVIEINDLSMESKKIFLQQSGFNDAKIEQVLRKIEMEDAGDLISIVGNLEKVSSFPELADPESVNIYELCTHIFQEAVDSYMEKRHASFSKTKRKIQIDKIEKNHSKRASIYFQEDQDISANETCSGYDVFHVADTMAAYHFVKNGGVESVDQIVEMKIEPRKKSCLKRMIVSKKVFDQELCSY